MKREQPSSTNPLWLPYGPEKQAWKEDGNYYTPEQLRALERALADLKITPCPEPPLSAD